MDVKTMSPYAYAREAGIELLKGLDKARDRLDQTPHVRDENIASHMKRVRGMIRGRLAGARTHLREALDALERDGKDTALILEMLEDCHGLVVRASRSMSLVEMRELLDDADAFGWTLALPRW